MSLETTKQVEDRRTSREKAIEELYDAFYSFYRDELAKGASKYQKFRLHLTTMFFDDAELLKRVNPLFGPSSTNVAEKQAVAKAAYWDALVRNAFGIHQDATVTQLFKNDEDIETKVAALEKKLADYVSAKAK